MAGQARKIRSRLHRFRADQDGATAVEFAIIAVPFLALIFGILELGMVFMVSTTLENATETVARQIRTGQFQTSGSNNVTAFKSAVCDEMSWLSSDCTSKLYVNVRTFPKFADVTLTPPATEEELKTEPFTTGGPEDIVVVRTYYEWSLITPLLNQGLQTIAGSSKRLISSTATFRNEPYNIS